MVVVDTEFIFALRKHDPLHSQALDILQTNQKLKISTPTLFEIMFVMLSKGKEIKEIIAFIDLISAFSQQYGLKITSYDLQQIQTGLEILRDHKKGGFFDSLIAGAAKIIDGELLANDNAFDGIPELKRLSYAEFLQLAKL